jgi:hypothetical protein
VAKTSLTVNVRIDGAKEVLAALNRLPKEANNAVREASLELAQTLAGKVKAAATTDEAPQSKLLARTVKARRDRLPVIVAGGTTRLGRRRAPAWKLLFGSEFGSNQYPQFRRPHSGRKGHWFFPVAEKQAATVAKVWGKAADRILRAYGSS